MKLSFSNADVINTGNPETDHLFVELANEIAECLDIPNACLPKGFQDSRSKRISLKALKSKSAKADVKNSHKRLKAEKARRVAVLAAQNAAGQELAYDINERLLNNRELAFCATMIRAGIMEPITDEDFADE
jgi:hypothetical protein